MDLYTARRLARRRGRGSRTSPSDYFEFGGGLNLVDTPLVVRPGQAVASENYETGLRGGYERLGGFERFDGQDAPSDEIYYLLPIRHGIEFTPYIQEGQLLVGATAGSATIIEGVELTDPGENYAVKTERLASMTASGVSLTLADVEPPEPPDFGIVLTGTDGSTVKTRQLAPIRVWEIVEDSASSTHFFRHLNISGDQSPDVSIDDVFLASIFLKAGTRRYIKCDIAGSVFGGNPTEVIIDTTTWDIVSTTAGVSSAFFEDHEYRNGWKRLVIRTVAATSSQSGANVRFHVRLLNDDQEESYVGDGSSNLYLTGINCDIENGSDPALTPYLNCDSVAAGDYPTPSGVAYAIVRDLTASFDPGGDATQQELQDASGTVIGYASGLEQEFGAPSIDKHLEYLGTVADEQRENLEKVPGGGRIRGVWFYGGIVYAFRDDAASGATKCAIYKSTGSGWSEVLFSVHIDFDAGTSSGPFEEGDTVTGATSGASGTVARVNVTNDDWAGGAAAGTLVLTSVSGSPFQDGENLQVSAVTYATADGVDYVPTLQPGGVFEFRTYNFYGASDKRRMYGVNGLDRFFEYDDDDEVLASYGTGMASDAPTHIATHLYMLFLMFPGGSVQNSGVGKPAAWTVVTGASEIAVGDDGTGFLEEVGDSLFIFTRNQKYRLTGRTVASFALDRFDKESGAIAGSIQRIGMGLYLDDFGFSSLRTSDRFGNYEGNTFSGQIQPVIDELLSNATVTASVIFRRRNRYRCFFDDGRFISIGLVGNKITGHMVCDYGTVVRAVCSAEDTDGTERLFFGSDDGYIYEAEKGTSFDGAPIPYGLRLHDYHSGAPDLNKRYRRLRVESRLEGPAKVSVTASFSSNDPAVNASDPVSIDLSSGKAGMNWDDGHEYELFDWDAEIDSLEEADLEGVGTNLGLSFYGSSALQKPHTLRGVNLHLARRRIERSSTG